MGRERNKGGGGGAGCGLRRGIGGGAHLELVEAQRKVQDVGELASQCLFLLQLLCHRRVAACEDVQEKAETGFWEEPGERR